MYNKTILDNGLKIVTETIPYVRSVSMGLWIRVGSVYENNKNNGISHFIEHMLFKGTRNRTAKQLASQIDSVGGQLDAFTGREFTCISVKILDNHLPLAVDIISDMIHNSVFHDKNIELEQNVIIEEINMYEDSPDEYIHDIFAKTIWADHPMGLPILGTKENILNMNRSTILDYFNNNYHPKHMLITATGNIDHNVLVSLLKTGFRGKSKRKFSAYYSIPKYHPAIKIINRELEQIHFSIGTKGLAGGNEKRFILYVLNSILGGSMSSRLFQTIREDMGLVYTIYTYQNTYLKSGSFSIYAGTVPKHFETVLKEIIHQIKILCNEKISEDELINAKEQLKGGLVLSLESTASRMNRLAQLELYFGRIFTLDETLEKIDKVTSEEILELANEIYSNELALCTIGKIDSKKDYSQYLKL